MARLILSFLGPFQVALDGQSVAGFESNKVRALLAFLVVEVSRPHARETVAALLWPDHHNHAALDSLRSALANLRRVIGDRTADPPFLLITRDTSRSNPVADYRLDVGELEAGVGRPVAHLERLFNSGEGDFLEGFALPDSVPFEEWLLSRRERFRRKKLDGLGRLAQHYEGRADFERAIDYTRRQLELEAWDEAAHRRLMRLLALSDRRGQALAQYEACGRVLREELGVEPAQETTRLYERIRDEAVL